MPFGGSEIGLLQRSQVPLADAVGVVAALGEHLREQRGVGRNAAVAVGEPVGELLDGGHTHRGGVAAGEQRGARRGAQRRGVKLRQPHAAVGEAAHRRHLDQTAEAVPRRDAGVVPHQVQHVRGVLRRRRRGVRAPVRLRVADVEFDLAVEFRCHGDPSQIAAREDDRRRDYTRCVSEGREIEDGVIVGLRVSHHCTTQHRDRPAQPRADAGHHPDEAFLVTAERRCPATVAGRQTAAVSRCGW